MSGKITEEFINWQCVEATASETAGGKKYHKPDHLPISAEKEIVHLCFVLLCFGA